MSRSPVFRKSREDDTQGVAEQIAYMADLIEELRVLAARGRCERLAGLLRLARDEANALLNQTSTGSSDVG